MISSISKLLDGNCENYILPFFWQHGEEEAVLREYMGVIHACGIGAVCVESRPHPDFCGGKWWKSAENLVFYFLLIFKMIWGAFYFLLNFLCNIPVLSFGELNDILIPHQNRRLFILIFKSRQGTVSVYIRMMNPLSLSMRGRRI